MKQAGHTPEKAVLLAKNELFVQTYFKGVANTLDPYDPVPGKEGTDWDIEFGKPLHGRIVYSINWKTGRYRMLTYALDYNKTVPAAESSGKCEPIHPDTKLSYRQNWPLALSKSNPPKIISYPLALTVSLNRRPISQRDQLWHFAF